MKRFKIITGIVLLLCIVVSALWLFHNRNTPETSPIPTTNANTQADKNSAEPPQAESAFNKKQYSLRDPASIWVIVNKKNALPVDYAPSLIVPNVRLRLSSNEQQMHASSVIGQPLSDMFAAASKSGIQLVFGSGYRSGSLQKQFYDSYKARDGQVKADTYSARPGHSEHQTGLAVDITSTNQTCHLEICFENTPEGTWLAKNAYKYGFIIRYPKGKQAITGYQYEPWHVRYVGKDLAAEMHASNMTLEEFFNLGSAATY